MHVQLEEMIGCLIRGVLLYIIITEIYCIYLTCLKYIPTEHPFRFRLDNSAGASCPTTSNNYTTQVQDGSWLCRLINHDPPTTTA